MVRLNAVLRVVGDEVMPFDHEIGPHSMCHDQVMDSKRPPLNAKLATLVPGPSLLRW